MLARNQDVTLECTGLGASFEGVCRLDGQVVFVPGALPGERVRARIIKVTKRYAVGLLEALLTTSGARVTPPCSYYPRCGGCTAQHLRYGDTLIHKRGQAVDCLERIGSFDAPCVAKTLGMRVPWHYRNKGAFPVGGENGAPIIGMYASRSHRIVDMPEGCLLQSAQSNALVGAVRRWMEAYAVPPYNEAAHRGLMRHVMTRETAGGEAMLVLAANGEALPHMDALLRMASEAAPNLRSIVLCANTRVTNVILGERCTTLWGDDALADAIAGFSMRVSPRSFFQVNRPQAERLYEQALRYAGLTGTERVWDLYCGAGSITLPLARQAARVTGVEAVADAVLDARVNAAANDVPNADFICGAVEAVLPSLLAAQGRPDVVVLDPPRKGCEPAALAALLEAAPARIVYVSCNPATLARDAGALAAGGYTLQEAQPVDMFGWTGHVECVLWMSRKANK